MRYFLCFLALAFFTSCNNVGEIVEDIKQLEKYEILYADFTYRTDKLKRTHYISTKDGKPLTGQFTVMHEGKVSEIFEVRKGLLNGVHIFNNTRGKMTSLENYKNGYLEGESTKFHVTTGAPSRLETFAKGKRVGDVLYYDEGGAMVGKETKVDGVAYNHTYFNDKMVTTNFFKEVAGKNLDLFVIYDEFENINNVLGRDTTASAFDLVYFLDAGFNITDSVHMREDPIKAQRVMQILNSLRTRQ